MPVKKLLKILTETPGVSGFETPVRIILERIFKQNCDEVWTDKVGNLIGRKGKGKSKLMLIAHMDEVGLVVKDIDKNGFLRFAKLGSINDTMLITQDITIWGSKGPVHGVVGIPTLDNDKASKIKSDDLFIDIGAHSRSAVEKRGVEIESQITFPTRSVYTYDRFIGKALDNRVGCVILCELMKRINPNCTVYFVANVAEEVGLKGAQVSTFHIGPDAAIVVDVTEATDSPGMENISPRIIVGGGPVLTLIEAGGEGLIIDPEIKKKIISAAKKKAIDIQLDVSSTETISEATTVQLSKDGVPTGAVGVPVRYTHSISSVVDLNDIGKAITLLEEFVNSFK